MIKRFGRGAPLFAQVLALVVVSLVAAGMGVTVVADCIRSLLLPRVAYRPLTVRGKTPLTSLHAAYRKDDTSPMLKTFLRLARSVGKQT